MHKSNDIHKTIFFFFKLIELKHHVKGKRKKKKNQTEKGKRRNSDSCRRKGKIELNRYKAEIGKPKKKKKMQAHLEIP